MTVDNKTDTENYHFRAVNDVIKEMEFSQGMQVIKGSTGGSGSFTPGR